MEVLDQKKTNELINLINEEGNIDKIYLCAKDLSEPKNEYLIRKGKGVGIRHFIDLNAFIECSDLMDDVYENINDYNSSRKKISNCFWRHYCRHGK